MRAILVLVAVGISFTPSIVGATSVDSQEEMVVDMAAWEYRFWARIDDSRLGQYALGLESGLGVAPQDSFAAPGLEAILAFLAGLSVSAPVMEPIVDDAQATYEDGAGAEANAETNGSETTVSTAARAGPVGVVFERGVDGSAANDDTVPSPLAPEAGPMEPAPEEPLADGPVASVEQAQGDPAVEVASTVSVNEVPLPVAAVAGVAIAALSGSASVALAPGWRSVLLKLFKRLGWLSLFSRIAQEDILNHQRRAELLEFVRNNPGERIETARRALGFSNGSMHYHLRVLSARDLVRVHREGIVARLFAAGPKIQPAPYVPTIRRKYLQVLAQRPGITQRELATSMGVSERMVSYHVGTLAHQGFVAVQVDGGRKRLFVQATPI